MATILWCKKCEGTGEDEDGVVCDRCTGRGVIDPEPEHVLVGYPVTDINTEPPT